MAGADDLQKLFGLATDGLLPVTAGKLEALKKQSRLRQSVGSLVLFGAAAVAIWAGPTEAIVFASLSVAAVWLLPPARRKILGDIFALRDAAGRVRIFSFITDDAIGIGFTDEQARLRAVLGLGSSGDPSLAMLDAEGRPRVAVQGIPDASGVALLTDDDNLIASLQSTPDGPSLTLVDPANEERSLMLTPESVTVQAGDAFTTSDIHGVVIDTPAGSVNLRAGEELVGLLAHDGSGAVLAGVKEDQPLVNCVDLEVGAVTSGFPDGHPTLTAKTVSGDTIAQLKVTDTGATLFAGAYDNEVVVGATGDGAAGRTRHKGGEWGPLTATGAEGNGQPSTAAAPDEVASSE